ncbi:MAG: hypothetical protein ACYDEF_13725 [Methanosarcina sp.]
MIATTRRLFGVEAVIYSDSRAISATRALSKLLEYLKILCIGCLTGVSSGDSM